MESSPWACLDTILVATGRVLTADHQKQLICCSAWKAVWKASSCWCTFPWIFTMTRSLLVQMQSKTKQKKQKPFLLVNQGEMDLVRVSGEFEISEFELLGFYCMCLLKDFGFWKGNSLKNSFCINNWLVFKVYGGMRGIKGLITETSHLDPNEVSSQL